MGEGITIASNLVTTGFKAGIKEIRSACSSLVRSVRSSFQSISGAVGNIAKRGFGLFKKNAAESMQNAERSAAGLMRTFTRMLPAMIGIRGAFGMLQRGASSFLSANKQLSNQLNACWTAIGNVIGPIIEMLVNLLTSLISYLITFLHLIGLSSKSASQAAKKTGAAAGAMQKSLMGFDEINKLQDSGGGGGGGSLYDPEMPETLKKLGDALKLLMEDLKKTWKEAWDENGRGEKMMKSIKTLLTDIVDLAAEFVLALDRAWMNGDNGKQIFADIMEIVTNIAGAFDKFVIATRDWIKETPWINKILEDVRLVFDQINGISRVINEEIAPILAGKIGRFLDSVAQGIHTALIDIEKIAQNVKEGLESTEGKAMVDSLGETAISLSKLQWSVIDLVLGSISKISWTELATSTTTLSNAVRRASDALSDLFGNQKVQEGIALIVEIAWDVISTALGEIANIIQRIAEYLNGISWDDINTGLSNLKENLKIGDAEGIGTSLGELLNLAVDKIPWSDIGSAIATNVNKAIEIAKSLVSAFDSGKLAEDLGLFLNSVVKTADWDGVGSIIGEGIGKAIEFVGNLLATLNGSDIATALLKLSNGLLEALNKAVEDVPWNDVGGQIGSFIGTLWEGKGKLFDSVVKLASSIAHGLFDALRGLLGGESSDEINWSELGSSIGIGLGDAINYVADILKNINGSEIATAFTNFGDGLLKALTDKISEVKWDEVGAKIGEFLGSLWEQRGRLGEGVEKLAKAVVDGIIDAIVGIFTGKSGGETEALRTKIKNAISDFFKGPKWVFDLLFNVNPEVEDWHNADIPGLDATVYNQRKKLQELVDKYGEDAVVQAGFELGFSVKADKISLDNRDALEAKLAQDFKEIGKTSATYLEEGFSSSFKNFGDLLGETGFSPREQQRYLDEFTTIYNTQGEAAAKAYAEGIISKSQEVEDAAKEAAESAQRELESGLSDFYAKLSDAGFSDARITAYSENYKRIFNKLGIDAANAYGEALVSKNFQSVDDFIADYSAKMDAADKTPLKTSGQNVSEELINSAKEAMKSDTEMSAGVAQMLSDANIATETDAQTFGESLVAGFIVGILNKVEDLKTAVATLIGEGIAAGDQTFNDWTGTTLQEHISNLTQIYTSFLNQFKSDVQNGLDEVESRLHGLHSATMSILSSMSGSAFTWGADMMRNLANGIYAYSDLVANACHYIADLIDSYIGFSEPDVGPLSKFHTFMPDMMKLMAEGIYQNADLPERAIDRVAQGIADSAKIDPGLVGTMNSISNNVAFQTPAFAEGTMIPYGLSADNKNAQEDQMVRFMEMMQQSMFQAFNAALSNQNKEPHVFDVYLDGKQIADSVTKWQRRDDRAGGK